MYRSTVEMDDEDTLNEYRRRVTSDPDSIKEINITKKMRNISNSMYRLAGRILTHTSKFEIKGQLTDYEKYSAKTIASMWQILNKLVNDEKYRVTAKITELEKYATLLEAYVKLVEQMIDYLDILTDARKRTDAQIEIVEHASDFLNIVKDFLKEMKEFEKQLKE